jgi:uncharacterized protein YyaL (SSP411 family)
MPNHLINERSPYLQQHANNPVDWYPWGAEAFTKARTEDKPIFLSIGYSTCHWCHVMEHESFENATIAQFLNDNFVSIKLDREERPDIDAVYMTATQAMTGAGGWPMSVMLTHDLKPFFCGTYFPPVPAYGRPSFKQLLERIRELWLTKRDDIIRSSEALTDAIKQEGEASGHTEISRLLFDRCFNYFEQAFDEREGGFGGAPKFPRTVQYDFLFNYYHLTGNDRAAQMALFTLEKMSRGGIYDHLGGGFHRYSVDAFWRVSHFEKMLYDQAQLIHSYLDAYQLTGKQRYARVVRQTCDFVLRELTHPDGGFFSALDADSEGEEGTFYLWTQEEINDVLGLDAELFNYHYGITTEGNWEEGKNVIYEATTLKKTGETFALSSDLAAERLGPLREKLFAVRASRIRPHRDEKVLTSWNGVMIGAMARAGDVLDTDTYVFAARRAAMFIVDELHKEEHLLHRWRDGEARFDAMLDSFAFLIKGLLELYEATLESRWLQLAVDLQREQDQTLFDTDSGGYFTARATTDVIVRTKNAYDGAEPSGNSISVWNLLKLHRMTGDLHFLANARKTLAYFSGMLQQYPYALPEMLAAAVSEIELPTEIVFTGDIVTAEYQTMRRKLASRYIPQKTVLHSASPVANEFARTLAPREGKTTVYFCSGGVCELPITSANALEERLVTMTNTSRSIRSQ